MNDLEIADRFLAIEADLAALKAGAAAPARSYPVHALDRIHGTFADDPAFCEAARLGRQCRRADHPAATGPPARRP